MCLHLINCIFREIIHSLSRKKVDYKCGFYVGAHYENSDFKLFIGIYDIQATSLLSYSIHFCYYLL